MEQRQPAPRNEAHKVSFRPARINGRESGELFITLKTRNCSWGKCLFCGLGKTDGDGKPLLYSEAAAQLNGSIRSFTDKGGDLKRVGMVSLITNSDSVFNTETVRRKALLGMLGIIREKLPAVAELVFESRAQFIKTAILAQVKSRIDDLFGTDVVAKTVAVGIESPYDSVRRKIRKGLPDSKLTEAAENAAEAGFGFRGYFIYNLIEPKGESRVNNLMDAVDLMTYLADRKAMDPMRRDGEKVGPKPSLLVVRGYVPERLAATPLLRRFGEVPDAIALAELQRVADYAKLSRVRFEVDSTTEDQQMTASMTVMSPAYRAALVKYNTTMDPLQLRL
jgi:uncharacterized Fe-S cluster-containing MiaB family protein